MLKRLNSIARLLPAACLLSAGAVFSQLPDNVEVVPFYNQEEIEWIDRKPIEMHEVPGLSRHFFVLDMMGYLYSLYPKDGDYEKLEIAVGRLLDEIG